MYEPLSAPLVDYISADLPLLGEVDGARFYRLDLVVKMEPHYRSIYCLLRNWQQTAAGKVVTLQQIIDAQQQQIERLAERASAGDTANARLADLTASAVLFQADLAELQRQLATKDAIITDLSAKLLADSEIPSPQPAPLPAGDTPDPLDAPTADPPVSAPEPEPELPYACSYCAARFATKSGRSGHEHHIHVHPAIKRQPAPAPTAHRCDDCERSFSSSRALNMHRYKAHFGKTGTLAAEPVTAELAAEVAPPAHAPIPIVDMADWGTFRCADCGSSAFSPSVASPTICVRCVRKPARVAA